MNQYLLLPLTAALLLVSCQHQTLWQQMASGWTKEEPVCYRNPSKALRERRSRTVDIALSPEWKLTEAQQTTAARKPKLVEGAQPARYLYPEDIAPTAEEIADGSALTDAQRAAMKQARRNAMEKAQWEAFEEAERYNKEHAAEFAPMEKQGRHIVIDLARQKGELRDGEQVLLAFNVCSGKKSTPTPPGHFHVLEKDLNHHSNLYDNAAMPYFLRLTLCGVGLHQGPLAGYPASHGCIRLNEKTARHLFSTCEVGTPVFVE